MSDNAQIDHSAEHDGDENESIVRAKWAFDGATTLSEAAAMLRGYADTLEAMEADGWQLIAPVNDDYGYIEKPKS